MGAYAEANFLDHGKPVAAENFKSYLPDLAAIRWQEKPQKLLGRADLLGTNGNSRLRLVAGVE